MYKITVKYYVYRYNRFYAIASIGERVRVKQKAGKGGREEEKEREREGKRRDETILLGLQKHVM